MKSRNPSSVLKRSKSAFMINWMKLRSKIWRKHWKCTIGKWRNSKYILDTV